MPPIDRTRLLVVVLLLAILPATAWASDDPLIWIAYEPGMLLGLDTKRLKPVDHVAAPNGRIRLAATTEGPLFAAGLTGLASFDVDSAGISRASRFLPDGIAVPLDLALAPDGSELWVLGVGSVGRAARLAVLDVANGLESEIVDAISLGDLPGFMTFAPDGQTLWLSLTSEHALLAIDVATRTEKMRVDMGPRALPDSLAFGPVGTLYVADLSGRLWFVDPENGVLLSSVQVGRPSGLVVSHGGGTIYVSDSSEDLLLAFDAITGESLARVELAGSCSAPAQLVITDNDLDLIIVCTGSTNLLRVRTTKMKPGPTRRIPGALLGDIAIR